MRILHTADWHLNARLGRVDRQPDIVARLNELAAYLEEHAVDVLLVAGDLLNGYARSDALASALRDVNQVFKPFLLRGGTMVVLSGNHDHERTFAMLHSALDLAHPLTEHSTDPRPGGRLYLCHRATCMMLGGNGVQPVQFVLLPYPTSARYLFDEDTQIRSLEERHRKLQQALMAQLDHIRREVLDSRLPTVLAAHIYVRGSQVSNLYDISETEDVVFESGAIPTSWAYVALGHIHNAQALPGAPHVRYAGSIERLDFAERDDAKGAVLVEVGPQGLVGEPVVLPLDATPIYEVMIDDPETQLPGLADRFSDRDRALVRYSLTWEPGKHDRDEICRLLEMIFPRWYARDVRAVGQDLTSRTANAVGTLVDVPSTTRAYLIEHLKNHPDREAVLALAEHYLAELEGIA